MQRPYRSQPRPVLLFQPKYRLGHPENQLILLSKKKILDQSIQKTFYLILKTEALTKTYQGMHDVKRSVLYFTRNIYQVTPKTICFHNLKRYFLDQSIQKYIFLMLKKEALEVVLVLATFSQPLDWGIKLTRVSFIVCFTA